MQTGENAEITFPVSNTGNFAGTEIVQVYIHKVNDTEGPLKTLRGFQRISLNAGKSVQITIDLPTYFI